MVKHAFTEVHEIPHYDSTGTMGSSVLVLVQGMRGMIFGVETT